MSNELTSAAVRVAPRARIAGAVLAAIMGVALLYLVGFAAPHFIHEAAHDARHSLNFPCH